MSILLWLPSFRKTRSVLIRQIAFCLLPVGLIVKASHGAPGTDSLPPSPPKRMAKGDHIAVKPKAAKVAQTPKMTRLGQKSVLPVHLPSPSRSGLGAKKVLHLPAKVAATGRTNPDNQSASLADQRFRANLAAPVTTLEDAIAIALANNPSRQEAQAAVNGAEANIGNIGSQGKFQVNANGTTEYGRNTSTSNAIATSGSSGGGSSGSGSSGSGGSSGGSGGNSGSSTGSSSSPSRSFLRFDQLTVGGTLPITTGGRVKASTREARFQALAQIYQLAQTEQDLVLNTTLAYLNVLRSDQLLRVTNANLAVSQERLRIARIRYSVGASARLDVLQAQTALADASSRRIQAANALGVSNSSLNILLGRTPETPIRLAAISRLNLPEAAYNIKPASVVPNAPNSGASHGNNTSNNASPSGNNIHTGNDVAANNSASKSTGSSAATSATRANGSTTGSSTTGLSPSIGSAPATSASSSTAGGTASSSSGAATQNVGGQTGTTSSSNGASPFGAATGSTGSAVTFPTSSTTSSASSSGTTSAISATSPSASGSSSTASGAGAISAGTSTGLQTLAGGTRQSLAVTEAQIGAAESAIDVAKSGKHPQLGLTLTSLLRNPATFLGNFGASIGLGLAQNLFDSGRTRYQVESARAALDQLKARLAGQRLEVADAIESSLLNLDSAQRRQASSEAGVVSAREALRVAQIGFRSGVRTTLDLADAQASLLSAQTDAVNSRFDVADAQATLAAAVGIYTVEAQQAREAALRAEQEASAQAKRQVEILQPVKRKRKKFLGIF